MMNLTDNISFISVESRKGGVGKSTISLSLAQLLLSKGYQVLLIDLDVYGTRVSTRFINQHSDFLHSVSYKGQDTNIVQLYSDSFQGKSQNLSFSFTNELNHLYLKRGRCNYLCSDLYSSQDNEPIEDPRILNDRLHAYWMRELIESLSYSFSHCLSDGEQGAIILDNAPGFSSLETSVHELLTTIGPLKGKFLLVTSLDDQDIDATRLSQEMIRNLLNDKIAGAKYYHSLKAGIESPSLDNPAFNEIWKELCATDGQSPYFYASIETEPSCDCFIHVLVNKGPKELNTDTRDILSKSFGHYTYCPFIESLRYYFSSVIIQESDTTMSEFQHLSLSGDFSAIIEDSNHFQEFLKIAANSQAGLIRRDWDPLFYFRQIAHYYQQENGTIGPIQPAIDGCIRTYRDHLSKVDRQEFFMVDVVHSFMDSIAPNVYNEAVCKEIVVLLKESEGQESISWQTNNMGLLHYGQLIEYVGKASLWILRYPQFCEMLNTMMSYLQQSQLMDNRDIPSIASAFTDLLNGSRIYNEHFKDEWDKLLSLEINAFEMRQSLISALSEMAL